MSQPVLRRRAVPRLHVSKPVDTILPGFLIPECAVPMTPEPVIGPHDELETAILHGALWGTGADPIEIQGFNPKQDIISVIVEESDGDVKLDVQEALDGVYILANGQTMAKVAAHLGKCSLSDIRVLQARTM